MHFAGWLSLDFRKRRQHTFAKVTKVYFESSLVQSESNALFKMTVFLMLLVFTWLLISCQTTTPRKRSFAQNRSEEAFEKQPDVLFLKRENLSIKPRYQGSTTGSIWADTQSPRELIADARPSRAGEMITVTIPESLRFASFPSAQKTAGAKGAAQKDAQGNASDAEGKGANGKGSSAGKENASSLANSLGSPSAPATAPLLANTHFSAAEEFKMQIVAMEPQGDTFLRGTRTFSGPQGELRTLTLLAKMPSRDLTSYQVNAQNLAEISLVETAGGQSSEYIASGWDTNVSRALSGWVPDLEAQAEVYEGQRKELDVIKEGLKEQQKALLQERDRMIGERKRNNEQMARFKEAMEKAQGAGAPSASTPGTSGSPPQNPAGMNPQPGAANAPPAGGNTR